MVSVLRSIRITVDVMGDGKSGPGASGETKNTRPQPPTMISNCNKKSGDNVVSQSIFMVIPRYHYFAARRRPLTCLSRIRTGARTDLAPT